MERNPQKVSAVLADRTRYAIYQYVLSAPHDVAVGEVAERFGLHPNVARTHLNKLVAVGLLVTRAEKTGRGGRPGYRYGPSGDAISLHVPAQDFQLLADLLVQALALMGEGGREAISQIGRTFGRRLGQEALQAYATRRSEDQVSPEGLYQVCAQALQRLGVAAHVARQEEGGFDLVLRTCGFQGTATAHPDHICLLCKAMVAGIAEVCLEAAPTVKQGASVPRGDKECVWEVGGLIPLQ